MSESSCVLIKLYLQKEVMSQIWPPGHSLLTPVLLGCSWPTLTPPYCSYLCPETAHSSSGFIRLHMVICAVLVGRHQTSWHLVTEALWPNLLMPVHHSLFTSRSTYFFLSRSHFTLARVSSSVSLQKGRFMFFHLASSWFSSIPSECLLSRITLSLSL